MGVDLRISVLYESLHMALRGRREWLRIKRRYHVGEGVLVLLMPDKNEKLNDYALKHLNDYKVKKYMDRTVVLTNQTYVWRRWEEESIQQAEIVLLEDWQCKALLQYYRLQWFFAYFIVVSMNQPDGNTVHNMLKSGKLSEEEILLGSIYV